ncbi:AGAP010943-PA-like protein [Anopheles sinensis]|uniref:AGAP010943-PA-like protein n=1 Tax=Anopheles sinensis TaxID=74873 RepID=A0A084WQB4_ANOSI|nr:AGAP010943-PA-like protein [Anopheles sinensis]
MSFVVVGSVVVIAVPHSVIAIAFARSLMGLAHGMAYLVVLIHGGEIVIKELRGMIMGAVSYCVVTGVLLGGVLISVRYDVIDQYRFIGIIGLVYMLLAVFLNQMLCYESPVFLVQRNLDGEAIRSMMKLRNESTETWQIRNELTEIKTMLSEDETTSRSIWSDGNFRPLVLLALTKVASVLSFNFAVNMVKVNVVDHMVEIEDSEVSLSVTILMSIRLVVGMVAMFTIDVLGRRALQLVSIVSTAFILIAIGIAYLAADSIPHDVGMAIFFACEVGASLGLTLVPDVLCSEAFNTKKKVCSIATVQILEHVLHILIFAITFKWNFTVDDRYGATLLAAGVPLLPIAYVLYQKLPETSKMSIRQARIEFYKRDGIVFGGSKNSVEALYD